MVFTAVMNKKNELKVLAVDSIVQIILQIVLLSFTSHFVGPESYGPFSLALLIINFFKNFGLSGISLIVLRSSGDAHIGAVTSVVISVSVLLSLPFLLFSDSISQILGSPNSELPIFYLGSFLIVVSFSLVLESYLIKVGLIIEYVFTNLITFFSNILFFYYFIGNSIPSFMWLTYSYLFATFVRLALLLFFCRNNVKIFNPFGVTARRRVKTVVSNLSGISGISVVNSLALNVDTLIVSRYLGETSLGLYTRAFQINNYVSSLYTKLISKLGVKSYSQCKNTGEIQQNFKGIYFYTALISMVLSMTLSLNAHVIVPILFGDKWLALISPMKIICLSIAFRLLYKAVDTYLLSFNKVKYAFYLQLLMLINVVIVVLYAKEFGLLGVCYAILLVTFLQYLASMLLVLYMRVVSYIFFLKIATVSIVILSTNYFTYFILNSWAISYDYLYSDFFVGGGAFLLSMWGAYAISKKNIQNIL